MTQTEIFEKKTEKQKKSIVKSGLVLSLMTFASRIMGLLREMTKASFLGTSMHADAFSTAFMIPNLFRRLFAEMLFPLRLFPLLNPIWKRTILQKTVIPLKNFLKQLLHLFRF